MWLHNTYSSRSSSGSNSARRQPAAPRTTPSLCLQHATGSFRSHLLVRPGLAVHASSSPADPPTANSTASGGSLDQSSTAPAAAAAAAPADAAGAAQPGGSNKAAAAADASRIPAAEQEASDAVSQARQELADAWQLLTDAAGTAFVPGYKRQQQQREQAAAAGGSRQPPRYSGLFQTDGSSSSSTEQQQQAGVEEGPIESIPDRLGRLLSGQFISDREAAFSAQGTGQNARQQQQQQQQVDVRFAAMQFEMRQGSRQQQGQGQQQGSSAASAGAAGAVGAGAVTIGPDGIIDVVPDAPTSTAAAAAGAGAGDGPTSAAAPSAASRPGGTSADPAAAAAAAAAGLEAEVAAEVLTEGEVPTPTGFYPASTQVLVVMMWGVFVLQWAQALPELLEMVKAGGLLNAAAAVLLASPDTPLTHSLCLDLSAMQQGQGWWGLLTAGLCYSGLAAVWLCTAALQNCGRWLEAGTGQLQLLTVFLICSFCASLAHIFAGGCVLGMAGPGAVLGVYTTWAVLATQYMRQVVPLRTIYIQGGMLLVLVLALGLLQPAVSWASVFGGMTGGAVAVVAAGPVSKALEWALALPVMGGLLLLKLLLDLLLTIYYSLVFVAAGAWQMVKDVVVTVRRL